jgi:H+/gluconate symporter-like permease
MKKLVLVFGVILGVIKVYSDGMMYNRLTGEVYRHNDKTYTVSQPSLLELIKNKSELRKQPKYIIPVGFIMGDNVTGYSHEAMTKRDAKKFIKYIEESDDRYVVDIPKELR